MAAKDSFKDRPLSEEYMGRKQPSLKPESLNGADWTVLTIRDVEGVDIPDEDADDGVRKAVRIDFEETDLPYWPNKTGLRTLSEKFGARPGDWIGERVPLVVVRVNNPSTKRQQPALHVAQGEEFDELLAKHRGGRRGGAKKKKRAAK